MIQANAASDVDQFKVAQDRTLALIIYVFIAQLRRARRAILVTKYSILSMLKIWVLVKTSLCVRPSVRPSVRTQLHGTTNANGTPKYVKPVPLYRVAEQCNKKTF